VFIVGGTTTNWVSEVQNIDAISTMEAEHVVSIDDRK